MTAKEFVLMKTDAVKKIARSIKCNYVVCFWNSPKAVDNYLNCTVSYFDTWIEAQSWYNQCLEKRNSFKDNDMSFSIISSYEHYEHPNFSSTLDRNLVKQNLVYLDAYSI